MLTPFAKLFELLEPNERRSMWVLLVLTLTMAVLDTVGIASVMPFISVLSNPEIIQTNHYLSTIYRYFNFSTERDFLFFLGVITFILLMVSVVFRSITLWAQLRFTNHGIHSTACRMVETYLGQPYAWFLDRHSADLGTRVLAEVTNVFQGAYYPAMLLVANALVTTFLVMFLVAVDPLLASASFLLVGGMYLLTFLLVRQWMVRIGEERLVANHERYRVLNEAFGGIKDVKAGGLENAFLNFFKSPSARIAKSSVAGAVISELPSFVLQGLVFGGMLLLLLYLIASYGSLQNAMPIVAIYALAGYRLLPALQGIYRSVSQLRFNLPSLDALHEDLTILNAKSPGYGQGSSSALSSKPSGLTRICELCSISFRYPRGNSPALHDINLQIRAHTTVGLVGSTGSGKTTLVDILLGLLEPQSGQILVDDKMLDKANMRAWQRSIGYVSQSIFLAEGTIAGNIAFGATQDRIDMNAVRRAASLAQLDDFLATLPDGLETSVGEKGVRLSGGQRQRIGIARALYHDPSVLILDEATSALDNITEQAVMEAIHALGGKKTIILIAHRLSSVRACDQIHLLQDGQIAASGSFDVLVESSPDFRRMVESAKIEGASGNRTLGGPVAPQ